MKDLSDFFVSSDLSKDVSFSRKDQLMCPVTITRFKSLGRVAAAEVNLRVDVFYVSPETSH